MHVAGVKGSVTDAGRERGSCRVECGRPPGRGVAIAVRHGGGGEMAAGVGVE